VWLEALPSSEVGGSKRSPAWKISYSLKLSLEVIPAFNSKMAKVGVDLELTKMRVAELERKEREKTDEVVELKKALEESKAKISVLETKKALVKAELNKIQDDTLVMFRLGRSTGLSILQLAIIVQYL